MDVGASSTGAATARLSAIKVFLRSPDGRKTLRFALVSGAAIAVSMSTLAFCYGVLGLHGEKNEIAQGVSFILSSTVSFVLNRRWVWAKTGRSNFRGEVLPFWALSVAQLVLTLKVVDAATIKMEEAVNSHLMRTMLFCALNLAVYGVMWVGKFIFFNKVVFAEKPQPA